VDLALGQQIPNDQRKLIAAERKKRVIAFDKADADWQRLSRERIAYQEKAKDTDAGFARSELVDFCRSPRYSLTPLNAANALAGLPFIGWRQSAKRCQPWKCDNAGGFAYQVFKVVSRITTSRPWRGDPIRHAKGWLESKPPSESFAISELQKKWYFLKRSIQSAWDTKVSPKRRPFWIAFDYLQQSVNPSTLDALMAESNSIVPLKPRSGRQ
jgi:hypothetical protein